MQRHFVVAMVMGRPAPAVVVKKAGAGGYAHAPDPFVAWHDRDRSDPRQRPAAAEAVLDGSTGSTGSFSGNFEIPRRVGRLEGGNLFHSFDRFHIRRGESATFTGPGGIDHVITRVTGDDLSRINGKLASEVPGADFFFLNPNGVVFGPQARLDVDGSFLVSTADELRFADGTRLGTRDPSGSFTTAAPDAFGFLGAGAGAIILTGGQLHVPLGQSLTLVGGSVDVRGSQEDRIASDPFSKISRLHDLAAGVDGSNPQQFKIVLGSVERDFERISSDRVVEDARAVLKEIRSIATAENVDFFERDARLNGPSNKTARFGYPRPGGSARAESGCRPGRACCDRRSGRSMDLGDVDATGGLVIEADTIAIKRSEMTANASGAGAAGTMSVDAKEVVLSGASLGSVAFATGGAGAISINGHDVDMKFAGLSSSNAPEATSAAGTITVAATNLKVGVGSFISSTTSGSSSAGSVIITAVNADITGASDKSGVTFTSISSDAVGAGDGGNVVITAKNLAVRDGADISTSSVFGRNDVTSVTGNAGSIIKAENLEVRGHPSGVTVRRGPSSGLDETREDCRCDWSDVGL